MKDELLQAAHRQNIELLIGLIYQAPGDDRRRRLISLLRDEEAAAARGSQSATKTSSGE